ncbi:MAG: 4-(cytidine 5'-diphospho)-2-C-methyl-D-erythritol kinase [Chitinophagaceae bacterium]|nr:4-(cytidine 5'-diphospho)-2-C-methyl-D-erythritol kinase [Chitinophagaceae bacterium]
MIVFPNCKINLGLHVLEKRPDGFHNMETVFYPLAFPDALEIIRGDAANKDIDIIVTGFQLNQPVEENICVRAYYLLKAKFKDISPVKVHLHKTIPVGAGLGGGSADGAFTLLLLNKKFQLGLTERELLQFALQLGSDCPFFIINKPCIAMGRSEEFKEVELNLSNYKIVLVNPAININTAWAFSHIQPRQEKSSLEEIILKNVEEWKGTLVNDFEDVIFNTHPEIKTIKNELYNQGAIYASLSGSGSTVYGLFRKEDTTAFNFPPHYFIKTA